MSVKIDQHFEFWIKPFNLAPLTHEHLKIDQNGIKHFNKMFNTKFEFKSMIKKEGMSKYKKIMNQEEVKE